MCHEKWGGSKNLRGRAKKYLVEGGCNFLKSRWGLNKFGVISQLSVWGSCGLDEGIGLGKGEVKSCFSSHVSCHINHLKK